MRYALYFNKKEGKDVLCELCPHQCMLQDGALGFCKVRKDVDGALYTLNVDNPYLKISLIEKKPFYHFLPSEKTLALGLEGSTLACQVRKPMLIEKKEHTDPEKAVYEAMNNKLRVISYSFNEPTAYYEYMLDTMRLVRQQGLRNVMVTNGYISEKPLIALYRYLDAVNVVLNGFDEEVYKKVCSGSLKNVLKSIQMLKEKKIYMELAYAVHPGVSDNIKQVESFVEWTKKNCGDTPVHFLRLKENSNGTLEFLKKAEAAAKKQLSYVYFRNSNGDFSHDTYCPRCKRKVIERDFPTIHNKLINGQCSCGFKLPGVWK